jgi:hypothetical protein
MRKKQGYIFLIVTLFCSGCSLFGGKTGFDVADRLKPRMTKTDVFNTLSQGATGLWESSSLNLDTQNPEEIIKEKPVLIALKRSEKETGIKAYKCVEVSRTWGFMGFDVFYLFLSKEETLVGYTQHHIN